MHKNVFSILVISLTAFFFISSSHGSSGKPLQLHFFYTPSCPLCEPTKQVVNNVETKYGNKIEVIRHNHSESEASFNSLIMALEYYNREDTPSLAVFVGDKALGMDDINEKLDDTVALLLAEGAETPDFAQFGVTDSTKVREHYANRATLGLIILTGLIDGFNPCAFATVILFVSMLAGIGRDRKTILAVGISFIIAVFLTYFILGAAFFEIMGYLEGSASTIFKNIALGIKWFSLALVLIAGVLSLIDAYRAFRSKGKEKMLLVLPEKLKNRIRKRLRVTAHSGSLIIGSFISGIIISFLEAACTGQTYMPIISALVSDSATSSKGYWLLLLYNILFILPLMAVFFAVFFGMTSEQIGNLARKRVWITKTGLGVMFLAIAVWLGAVLLPTVYTSESKLSVKQNSTAVTAQPHNNESKPAASSAESHSEDLDNVDR